MCRRCWKKKGVGFGFFKQNEAVGNTISGKPVAAKLTGSPLLAKAPATVEYTCIDIVE